MQVDPIIQNPANSQSLNPYSYIGNNPLSGTDPTGYCSVGAPDSHGHCASGEKTVSEVHDQNGKTVAAAGNNGASPGQSANSVRTVANGSDAGNPNTDPSSRQDGNPASPGNNGGEQTADQPPTLPTVSVNAKYPSGEPVVPGGWMAPFEINSLGTYAQYRAEWADYRVQREAWADRYATAAGNDVLKGFFWMHWALIKAQFEGDAPGLGLAGGPGILRLGMEGEEAVRSVYSIGSKARLTINGRVRIPDGLNEVEKSLSEVKNVSRQSYTQQLRDYSQYSQSEGLQFNLYTRPNTRLSGPLQDAIDRGLIYRTDIPK
ncbi:MAG: hypothetical protein NVS9B2_27820 [Steroidobacteraceae bacterium]